MAFQLSLLDPQTAVFQTIPLAEGSRFTLGQSADSDLVLQHPFVAENHAYIDVTADGLTITDLGGTNGTAVNTHRIPANEPILLKAGDTIDIALFQITVVEIVDEPTHTVEPLSELVDDPKQLPVPADKLPFAPPLEPSISFRDGNEILPYAFDEQAAKIGFEQNHSRYVQYLPALFDVPFMHHFLGIFESLLSPIVWRIDNLPMFFDAQTTPKSFLPWLAQWYAFTFDHTWAEDEEKQRLLLLAAPEIYGWWGTAYALQMVLDIYTGTTVRIVDDATLPPFTFRVEIPLPHSDKWQEGVERLINMHKPAHTTFELHFME